MISAQWGQTGRHLLFWKEQIETGCGSCWRDIRTFGRLGSVWKQRAGTGGRPGVCVCYSRALSQCFLPRCSDLPVTVYHLDHQPELQPDDGDIHHHLRQDGRQSPGHWRDGDRWGETYCICALMGSRQGLICTMKDVGGPGQQSWFMTSCPEWVIILQNPAADTLHLTDIMS